MTKSAFLILLILATCTVNAQKPIGNAKLIDRLTSKPEFPDGKQALYAFLGKNIQYPQMERDNDIQGKVVLRFMVDTTGAIQDIKILRPVSRGIDKEAVRVIKLMPNWKPATYHNKPVAVYYILPVAFRIQ